MPAFVSVLRRPKTLVIAAVAITMIALGTGTHAVPHASAAQDYLFGSDVSASAYTHFQIGGITYEYFTLKNDGIGDATGVSAQGYCSYTFKPAGHKTVAAANAIWSNLSVPAGKSITLMFTCNPGQMGSGATVVGAEIFGAAYDNVGSPYLYAANGTNY